MVMLDLDIGMNDWMCDDFQWDDGYRPDRGKVLSAEELESVESFHRYMDVDGDGIPYRTYPGAGRKGAYFVRGSGHNQYGGYTVDSDEYQEVVDRLVRKWETAATLVPEPVIQRRTNAEWGIVSVGSCDYAVAEAVEVLAREGIHLSYMRIKAFPFGQAVTEFLHQHQRIFVVEQNRDAQLKSPAYA